MILNQNITKGFCLPARKFVQSKHEWRLGGNPLQLSIAGDSKRSRRKCSLEKGGKKLQLGPRKMNGFENVREAKRPRKVVQRPKQTRMQLTTLLEKRKCWFCKRGQRNQRDQLEEITETNWALDEWLLQRSKCKEKHLKKLTEQRKAIGNVSLKKEAHFEDSV